MLSAVDEYFTVPIMLDSHLREWYSIMLLPGREVMVTKSLMLPRLFPGISLDNEIASMNRSQLSK
jgi:hypothetical protein